MITIHDVTQVRAAEYVALQTLPDGALMQRASWSLAATAQRLLTQEFGQVVGSRVVLLVGSGNNGGDALWAGAFLVGRGCRVDAVCLSDRVHAEGAAALRRAGGRLHPWSPDDAGLGEVALAAHVVIDGILGIGGRGALRPDAVEALELVARSEAIVVAVDVPSGVDADTGCVEGAAVVADVTVTFGALKPGLVVAPGCHHSGLVEVVDIGLSFAGPPFASVLEDVDVARWVTAPDEDSHKYRRGVVGICAGSLAYPGAALLVTAGARHANVGMVRFLDRSDDVAVGVVGSYPDIVVDGSPPAEQSRVTAWACGSGFAGDQVDRVAVQAVLDAPVPVVLDAGALDVVAESADVRALIADRAARGLCTVVTPHSGEFERLRPGQLAASPGRAAAALAAAADLQCVVLLKGPGTVIAAPDGRCYVDTEGTADLGTAGSGDVLTGLVAAVLAGAWASGSRDPDDLLEATAAAVWLHGRAGRLAAVGAPVTAPDIAAAVPAAIASARSARGDA